jgi:hypothetical protein
MARRSAQPSDPSLFADERPVPASSPALVTPVRAVVFAPTPPAERREHVPGYLETSLGDDGWLSVGWREPRDVGEERLERGLERRARCTTPTPALIERMREVDPVTGLRRSK